MIRVCVVLGSRLWLVEELLPPGMCTGQQVIVWPARRYSRNVREQVYPKPLAEHPEQGAAGKRRTFLLLEFLLALLVALLLELLALRKNGAIRSVGFRQRRTIHIGHIVDAHSVSARENAVARIPSGLGP